MKINIEMNKDGESFSINLLGKNDEPFLSIYSCRVRNYEGKRFISYPARKSEKTGKWFNYCRSSDSFTAAVLNELDKVSRPQTRSKSNDDEQDIPF
jgi:hypothetical protein